MQICKQFGTMSLFVARNVSQCESLNPNIPRYLKHSLCCILEAGRCYLPRVLVQVLRALIVKGSMPGKRASRGGSGGAPKRGKPGSPEWVEAGIRIIMLIFDWCVLVFHILLVSTFSHLQFFSVLRLKLAWQLQLNHVAKPVSIHERAWSARCFPGTCRCLTTIILGSNGQFPKEP